jgi:hypothetical protein
VLALLTSSRRVATLATAEAPVVEAVRPRSGNRNGISSGDSGSIAVEMVVSVSTAGAGRFVAKEAERYLHWYEQHKDSSQHLGTVRNRLRFLLGKQARQ